MLDPWLSFLILWLYKCREVGGRHFTQQSPVKNQPTGQNGVARTGPLAHRLKLRLNFRLGSSQGRAL